MKNREEEIFRIKEIVKAILPGATVFLFGSRARGDFDEKSDYDLLIVTKNKVSMRKKIEISEMLREEFSSYLIPTDIIIKSRKEVEYYKDKIGSVVREALKEGVAI